VQLSLRLVEGFTILVLPHSKKAEIYFYIYIEIKLTVA
jgi:hypothetical protein